MQNYQPKSALYCEKSVFLQNDKLCKIIFININN